MTDDWRDAMKKPSFDPVPGKKGSKPRLSANPESLVFGKLKFLALHCCMLTYDDGSPRTPGWFTVKSMGGMWVIQVKEPDAAVSLSVSAQSLDDALSAADALLGSDDAPWQPDAFLQAGKGKRK